MKIRIISIICLILTFTFILSNVSVIAVENNVEENSALSDALTWLENGIENNSIFSFKYGGKKFSEVANTWIKVVDKSSKDEFVYYNVKYTSPDNVVFTVDFTLDKEYASIEWVGHYYNNATTDSPVIADILPLDSKFNLGNTSLTVPKGAQYGAACFAPETNSLDRGTYAYQCSGRSADTAMPFFDLCDGNQGIVGWIGWSGGWKASFNRKNGETKASAGMINTKISLYAGEDMRTPAMLVMFFHGDQDDGHNQFRKLVSKSYIPVDTETGENVKYLPNMLNSGISGSGGIAGESSVKKNIPLIKRLTSLLDWDSMWIDAGYYCRPGHYWSDDVGDFYPTTSQGYTGGSLKNISDILADADLGLCAWFEMERAMAGTTLYVQNPQYYGAGMYENLYVLKLDQEDAYQYVLDLISNYLIECNIRWYREDLNFTPELYWSNSDKAQGANRSGITEIKYITNKYRLYDELYEKIPDIKLDCLSRRLDFEMTKRSISLFRCDYVWDAEGTRVINYSLQYWFPYTGGYSVVTHRSTYVWLCELGLGEAVEFSTIVNYKNFDIFGYNMNLSLRDYVRSDFYILKQSAGATEMYQDIAAYEYNKSDEKDGILIVFRPRGCENDSTNIKLKGLDAKKIYNVEVTDTGDTFKASGYDLMNNGLDVTIDRTETSLLIKFN